MLQSSSFKLSQFRRTTIRQGVFKVIKFWGSPKQLRFIIKFYVFYSTLQ